MSQLVLMHAGHFTTTYLKIYGWPNLNRSVGVRLGWDKYKFNDNSLNGNTSLVSVGAFSSPEEALINSSYRRMPVSSAFI